LALTFAHIDQRIEDRQSGRRSFGHRNGHGAIELDDGRRRDGGSQRDR
jgi:hypothetical protein